MRILLYGKCVLKPVRTSEVQIPGSIKICSAPGFLTAAETFDLQRKNREERKKQTQKNICPPAAE
jgi:hypothetical protein